MYSCGGLSSSGQCHIKFQTVKTNKEECIRLALRAAQFWVDLCDHMNGKWANAPTELVADIEKLQRLENISAKNTH